MSSSFSEIAFRPLREPLESFYAAVEGMMAFSVQSSESLVSKVAEVLHKAESFAGVKYKGKYLLAVGEDEFHLEGQGCRVILRGSHERGWTATFEQDNEVGLKKPSRPSVHGKVPEEVIDEALSYESGRIRANFKFLEEQDKALRSLGVRSQVKSAADIESLSTEDGVPSPAEVRLIKQIESEIKGIGKVLVVDWQNPLIHGSGWSILVDTEYAALKLYWVYRGAVRIRRGPRGWSVFTA